jgi:hypothetical protein
MEFGGQFLPFAASDSRTSRLVKFPGTDERRGFSPSPSAEFVFSNSNSRSDTYDMDSTLKTRAVETEPLTVHLISHNHWDRELIFTAKIHESLASALLRQPA